MTCSCTPPGSPSPEGVLVVVLTGESPGIVLTKEVLIAVLADEVLVLILA